MMLLVIVGAGASYDSVPDFSPLSEPYRPPLADQLFANNANYAKLLSQFPYAAAVASRARLMRGPGSLEKHLQQLRDEEDRDAARLKQLLAVKYYLRALLSECSWAWTRESGGGTNYATLVDLIEQCRIPARGEVTYVSFNYDTLLESGLASRDKKFPRLTSYVEGSVRLVKIHGSINWGQVVTSPALPRAASFDPQFLCEIADQLTTTEDYRLAPDTRFQSQTNRSSILVPAIAIPTQKKRGFACPDEHVRVLREALPHVGGVLTIGWRGAEDHFLSLLGEGIRPNTPAYVVSRGVSNCQETSANLSRHRIATERESDDGFTGAMRNYVNSEHDSQLLRQFIERVFARPAA